MYWICRDKKIEYGSKILLMGIVNATPDSFSDGGEYFDTQDAVNHALALQSQGADIIDIGAQSTRPDCTQITAQEEWQRLEGVLTALQGRLDAALSVDTYYPSVAEKALEKGADIINDVSGVLSLDMAQIVKKTGCGWIITHNGGGSVAQVKDFFVKAVDFCTSSGIEKQQLCLDMGIGFGKDYEQNMSLLANVSEYKYNGCPLLLGVSRKRVIGTGSRQAQPKKRIYGNIAADTAAILGGVDIVRLHDIENEAQGILMAEQLRKYTNG